jgi:hypothetical protein
MRKLMIVFCSITLILCIVSCSTETLSDSDNTDEKAYSSMAAATADGDAVGNVISSGTLTGENQADGKNQQLLISDHDYTYTYDEKGLCQSASENGQEKYTFSYEYDEAGRPKTRYMTETDSQDKSMIETYAYNANGMISERREFKDNGETVYRYNENGQLIYCSDLSMLNAPASFGDTAIEYDENGRVSRLVLSWYNTPQEAAKACLGNKGTDEEIQQKTEELAKIFPKWSDYIRQKIEWQYEYDTQGRATKVIYKEDHSKLDNYCSSGDESKETESIEQYRYDYSGDGTTITLSGKTSHYVNGTETKAADSGPFSFAISYQNDIVNVVNGQTIDFYKNLGITPEQTVIGYFGLEECSTASHYWGEVYSGIIGTQFDRQQQHITGSLFLEIDGSTNTGEKVQILLGCDSFGRSLDYILCAGKLVTPQTKEQNLDMKDKYNFETYEEWYAYQDNPVSSAATGITSIKESQSGKFEELQGNYTLIVVEANPAMKMEEENVQVVFSGKGTFTYTEDGSEIVFDCSGDQSTFKFWKDDDSSFFRSGTWTMADDNTVKLTIEDFSE